MKPYKNTILYNKYIWANDKGVFYKKHSQAQYHIKDYIRTAKKDYFVVYDSETDTMHKIKKRYNVTIGFCLYINNAYYSWHDIRWEKENG